MNARLFSGALALLVSLAITQSPAAAADNYLIDPEHTSIVFSCGHGGLSYIYGMFRKAQGDYILDEANAANSRFRFTIDTNSLDTNLADRDSHLKGPDFLNVRQFPTITFVSTGCTQSTTPQGGVVFNVTGNLTMHGVTRPITVPLQMLGKGPGVTGKDRRTGFYTHVELKRSDYGMSNLLNLNPPVVGDAVGVTISFEGVLQAAQGGGGAPPGAQ